jgi:HAD superfamily hydrolase (TIGR01509 family)
MRAVVFDWDGTLVDSQTSYVHSWRETLAAFGYSAPAEELNYVYGRAFPDCLDFFASKFTFDPERFESQWRSDFRDRLEREIKVYPDAVNCARECVKEGIPLAIATQTPRVEFDKALEYTGLGEIGRVSVCRDEVSKPKPAPDLYIEACRRLREKPEHCLAVEDSVVGVTAARDAGMCVLAVARLKSDRSNLERVAHHTVDFLEPAHVLSKSVENDGCP